LQGRVVTQFIYADVEVTLVIHTDVIAAPGRAVSAASVVKLQVWLPSRSKETGVAPPVLMPEVRVTV